VQYKRRPARAGGTTTPTPTAPVDTQPPAAVHEKTAG